MVFGEQTSKSALQKGIWEKHTCECELNVAFVRRLSVECSSQPEMSSPRSELINVDVSRGRGRYMPAADYRTGWFSTIWSNAIVEYLQTMVYDNFKASIDDFEYHDACPMFE